MKRNEIPALVAEALSVSVLEVRITDTDKPTHEQIQAFLDEIEQLPTSSIDYYYALAAMSQHRLHMSLATIERICLMYTMTPPDGVVTPDESHSSALSWFHKANNNFQSLVRLFEWLKTTRASEDSIDVDFQKLLTEVAHRLNRLGENVDELLLLYTTTFADPRFAEYRRETRRQLEIASCSAIECCDYLGQVLELSKKLISFPVVRVALIKRQTTLLVSKHSAYS